jgi:hypothetical protein
MDKVQAVTSFWSDQTVLLIIGALVGFLLSLLKDFFNYFIKSKKDKKDLALGRLNEIFLLLSKSSDRTRKTFTSLVDDENLKQEFNDTTSRLAFLIRVYFPTMYDSYNKHLQIELSYAVHQIEQSDIINKLRRKPNLAQEEYDNAIIKSQSSKELVPKTIAFENSFRTLSTLIVEETKKYE